MNRNVPIVLGVVVLVAAVAWLRQGTTGGAGPAARPTATAPAGAGLPRLVEIGAGKCEACLKMAPIIEALRTELAGRAVVESIDVIQQEALANTFNWRLIPTQVVFDGQGREVFRHEGYLPKEELLAQLNLAGVR